VGVGVWFYSFFNLVIRWVWVINVTPQCFTSGKDTHHTLYSRQGGPRDRFERARINENVLPPTGFESRIVQSEGSRCINVVNNNNNNNNNNIHLSSWYCLPIHNEL